MSEVVWVMESEICDACGALLGYFGECPNCGDDDDMDWYDDSWDEYNDEEEKYSTEEELSFLQEYYREERKEGTMDLGNWVQVHSEDRYNGLIGQLVGIEVQGFYPYGVKLEKHDLLTYFSREELQKVEESSLGQKKGGKVDV